MHKLYNYNAIKNRKCNMLQTCYCNCKEEEKMVKATPKKYQ